MFKLLKTKTCKNSGKVIAKPKELVRISKAVFKIGIYLLLIILPIIVDVLLIYKSGIIGIIAAIWGFLSGFIILANAVAGTILLIIGLLIARCVED